MTHTVSQPSVDAVGSMKGSPCLYCGCLNSTPLYRNVKDRLGYVPGDWGFDRCTECGSARLVPFPEAADLGGFYPPVYSFSLDFAGKSGWRKILSQLEYSLFFRPQYRAQARQVLRHAKWQPGIPWKMLDLGCGRGLRMREFQRFGLEVHGADLSESVVAYVRDSLQIPAIAVPADQVAGHYPAGSFDLVTSYFMLEHVTDVRSVLEQVWTILKPGGWFAATVPLLDSVQGRVLGSWWSNVTEAPRHISLPTKQGLVRVAEATGYQTISIVPDSLLNCAGQVGISLLPTASITNVFKTQDSTNRKSARSALASLLAVLTRFLGAGVMFASLPLCAIENYVLGCPSNGILLARKP